MASSELRQLLLEAGLNVLYRRGLRATANHVPIGEALEELDRTRGISPSMGSIFGHGRPWRSVKDFQVDLLLLALADQSLDGPNDESMRLVRELEDQRSAPAARRITTLVELCQLAGYLNGYVPERGKERTWTVWLAIWTMAMSDVERGGELEAPLRDAHDASLGAFVLLYDVVLERLGMRIRAPYRLEQFATAAAALTDGFALRVGLANEVLDPGPCRHAPGDWNLLGIGLAALALEFVEIDPAV